MAYAEIAFRERTYLPEAFCPPELDYIWDWFSQDFWPNYRTNGFGIEAFGFGDISEWAKLMNVKLSKVEIRTIKKLDGLFIEVMSKKEATPTQGVKSEVRADNVSGVKALLQGFNASAKAMREKEEAKKTNV